MFPNGSFTTQETPRPRGRATNFGSCGHPRNPIPYYTNVNNYIRMYKLQNVLARPSKRKGPKVSALAPSLPLFDVLTCKKTTVNTRQKMCFR